LVNYWNYASLEKHGDMLLRECCLSVCMSVSRQSFPWLSCEVKVNFRVTKGFMNNLCIFLL